MRTADINDLIWASDPQLSPDGATVAYVVTQVDQDANTYRSRVWLAAVDGDRAPRPITAGEHSDASPAWNPDGSSLAFTSSRRKDAKGKTRASLYLLPIDGPGETALLAENDETISDITFSPDGAMVAYCTRTRGPHYESDDVDRRPPRQIKDMFFQLNGEGMTFDRPSHIYVVPTNGSFGPRNLTPGDVEYGAPAWFADSGRLCVTANDHQLDLAADIAVIELDDNSITVLTRRTGMYSAPAVAPDGATIAVLGHEDLDTFPQNAKVGLLDASGGQPRWISEGFDRTWAPSPHGRRPHWAADGSLLASVEDRGSLHIYRVAEGVAPELVIGGDRVITGWSAVGGTVAFTATTADTPAELCVVVDGDERQVSSVTSAFLDATCPRPARHFTAPSGDVEVDAWLFTPPDFDADKSYPMLLNIHGGPFTQYGNFFFDEAQMQAAAGFVVLLSNPRGGSGRDTAWGQAILGPKHRVPGGGWGGVDYDDLMSVVDTALEQFSFIDRDRMGVLGGSYGGYMTSWMITHTNRFKAACSERGVNNLVNLEHGSDIAGVFRIELGPTHLEDPEEYARMSPITYVDNIETPLLIIHSDDDLRCPVDQADQLFLACKMLSKDVEYYRFPGETHELSRSGSPIHRIQRADIIHEFFTRHLV